MLVDGKPADTIPVDDRGLAYGDGLFETLRARRGRLPLLDDHLDRLFAGLHVLQFPALNRETLAAELKLAANAFPDGVIKLIVTRGSGGRGYRPPADAAPRRIVQALAAPAYVPDWQDRGLVLRYCATRLDGARVLDGLKHLNRLPQVLARAEWEDAGINEGLMRDAGGHVVEGTMSNLFLCRHAELVTPPVGAGVRGIMRRRVLECARRLGITARESLVRDADIDMADEVFMTNSVIGVCPVRQIGKQAYPIGTMTRRLQTEIENELERRACSEN